MAIFVPVRLPPFAGAETDRNRHRSESIQPSTLLCCRTNAGLPARMTGRAKNIRFAWSGQPATTEERGRGFCVQRKGVGDVRRFFMAEASSLVATVTIWRLKVNGNSLTTERYDEPRRFG